MASRRTASVERIARSLVLALLVGLAAAGCSRDAERSGEAPDAAASAQRPATGTTGDPEPRPGTGATDAALAGGALRLEIGEAGLSLEARDVPRSVLLRALAERLRFKLRDRSGSDPLLSLEVRDAPLEQVLALALEGASYELRYGPSAEGASGLRQLRVGSGRDEDEREARRARGGREPGEAEAREDRRDDARAALAAERPPRELSDVERRLYEEARRAREAQRREQLLARLESADAATRQRAATGLDVREPEDLQRLGRLLRDDPDERVRVQAARRLGFGDAGTALPALTAALEDGSPAVLVEAIQALMFLRDPAAVPDLEPLRAHPDREVREAAGRALGLLEAAPR